MKSKKSPGNALVSSLLKEHFGGVPLHGLVTASRVFPATARVDLQVALDRLFTTKSMARKLVGVHVSWGHETLSFSHLIVESDHPALVGPLQFDEVDVGEGQPVRCLKNGLALCVDKSVLFAVFLTRDMVYGRAKGVCLEVAVSPGESGLEFTRQFLDRIEQALVVGHSVSFSHRRRGGVRTAPLALSRPSAGGKSS